MDEFMFGHLMIWNSHHPFQDEFQHVNSELQNIYIRFQYCTCSLGPNRFKQISIKAQDWLIFLMNTDQLHIWRITILWAWCPDHNKIQVFKCHWRISCPWRILVMNCLWFLTMISIKEFLREAALRFGLHWLDVHSQRGSHVMLALSL